MSRSCTMRALAVVGLSFAVACSIPTGTATSGDSSSCSSGGSSSGGRSSSSSGGSSSGGSGSSSGGSSSSSGSGSSSGGGSSSSGSGSSSGGSSSSSGGASYTLTVQVQGSSGTTNPAGAHFYPAGTSVQVTATPATGATFSGWSGAVTGAVNPGTVVMTGDKTLTASFAALPRSYTLVLSVVGSGTTDPVAGAHAFDAGTTVTVTATPASGATFTSWSGSATGSTNPLQVVMDADKTLAAHFSAQSGCMPPAAGTRGTNPLVTDVFTADPAALVDGCTFYVQCGHDEAAQGENGFVMREWFLLSSTDMVHWTRKTAMTLETFSWASANAWAGQMVRAKNGKYYWYVPVAEWSGAMAIGVAVANSPEGPWADALGKPLVNDEFEMSNMGFARDSDTVYTIDPSVFVDDDGTAYLHYGGFGRLVVAKLGSDMTSISGKMQESTPSGYFESPYLIKRNGTYYEIYAAGSNPATIDYATSSSPLGPWTYRGRVLDALPRAPGNTDWPTNHAGVAQLAGQWYLVYHVSNGPNGGGTYRREVAIEKLYFNADGTIQKVTPSSGLTF